MAKSCDNDLFIYPIESCSFKALNNLYSKTEDDKYDGNSVTIFTDKLTKDNKDLNSKFRDDTQNNKFIYEFDKTKKDLCVPSNLKGDEYHVNCVISTNNKYFTFNKKNKSCDVINNLNLDNKFKYIVDKDNNNISLKLNTDNFKELYEFKPRNAYCENKWFDWITIPNYHFNNQYLKDSGIYSQLDVRKCYKPCRINSMPYKSEQGEELCVSKTDAYNGIYENKLDFSPFALINLLGNNYNTLNILYIFTFIDNIINNIDKNTDITSRIYHILSIINTNDENIYTKDAKTEIVDSVRNNILDEASMSIVDYKRHINVLTYRNPNFIENDSELITFRGMLSTDMLNNINLLHTYYLANKYYEFCKFSINNEKNKPIDDIINDKFNYVNQFKDIFIDILNNNNKNDINFRKYSMRLSNILFKAINLCYNNESEFSKNLLLNTKKAIEYFNNKYNLINNLNSDIYKTLSNVNHNDYNTDRKNELFTNIINKINDFNIFIKEKNATTTIDNLAIKIDFIQYENYEDNLKTIYPNDIRIYNKNKVLFYTEDDIEISNNIIKCPKNEYYDKKDKKCVPCKDKCDDEKCKTDNYCPIYCVDRCNSFNKENNKSNSCGKKKDKEKRNEEKKEEEKVLFDDDYKLPDYYVIFRYTIKLFFVIISLYLVYIFYDMFQETILSFLNFLYDSLISLFYSVYYFNNKGKGLLALAEYHKNNAIKNYDKLKDKLDMFSKKK